ncbi:MAG TPA: SRPBCC family protein [Solirubrobacteraceae bacterium]|nr:SRPBCC family protein [Solirubrobacteraceae bacterium]
MRAHHVQIEHEFAKPPERIFAYLSEHENLAEVFGAKVTRLRDGEDQRNGVGSVRKLQIGPLPPFEETVTEFVVPERIVYKITKGSPLRGHLGVMTFAATPSGGTRFVYDIRIASPIPGLAPLVRAALTRSITQALPGVERDA